MYCPFSYRVTQLHIPVTKQCITQLNPHLDSSGITCHIQPLQHCLLLLGSLSWKPEGFQMSCFLSS